MELQDSNKKATTKLSTDKLLKVLKIISQEIGVSLPTLISKLDSVSGDFNLLVKSIRREKIGQWSQEQDDLLPKNEDLLRRWKGDEVVNRRKKYLGIK